MRTRHAWALLAALMLAGCVAEGDTSDTSRPTSDEVADDDGAAEDPDDEATTSDASASATGEGQDEVLDKRDLSNALAMVEIAADPPPDGGGAELCDLARPSPVELLRDVEEVRADQFLPEELLPGGDVTLRAVVGNENGQVFSLVVSAVDEERAREVIETPMCLETVAAGDLPEVELEEVDETELASTMAEAIAADGEVEAAMEEIVVALDDATDLLPRTIVVVPEFCDEDPPLAEAEPQGCGNDELEGMAVVTYLVVDPTVPAGQYDIYSSRCCPSSVSARVRTDRGAVFAAIRKGGSWTRVSGDAARAVSYSDWLTARPTSDGPVWFSVYGYRNIGVASRYSVVGTWRTESYSK